MNLNARNIIRKVFHPFISVFIIFITIILTGQYEKVKGFISVILFGGSLGFDIHPFITGSILVALVFLILKAVSLLVNKILEISDN
jgi:hypothetical protein